MTIGSYRTTLRAAVRGLWKGLFTLDQFLDAFGAAIDRGLTQAWIEGAKECGISYEELSGEERSTLAQQILMQRLYMGRFGATVEAAQQGTGKLTTHFIRLETWVNRYNEVKHIASAMACGDKKKTWRYGGTKEHCKSCSTFVGRVYRYSKWLATGALPQSRRLACGGYRCQCTLNDTDAKITPGRFPSGALG